VEVDVDALLELLAEAGVDVVVLELGVEVEVADFCLFFFFVLRFLFVSVWRQDFRGQFENTRQ
jgi:hypothetical protein